ncbi:hypothetical protein LSH36_399g07013 [Paralvinella palmiformis]|uniref:Uncharacterized protein n=1 Tax=Paralvinella palmiformis TaxID=53620 RepID=A0AAD9N1C3_9ANNE|nr:hypothetical protein LSH36_399g07013 [Paralvinella palmiformis]
MSRPQESGYMQATYKKRKHLKHIPVDTTASSKQQIFHGVSKVLQNEDANLKACADLYVSLADQLCTSREEFEKYEKREKEMLPDVDYQAAETRKRIRQKANLFRLHVITDDDGRPRLAKSRLRSSLLFIYGYQIFLYCRVIYIVPLTLVIYFTVRLYSSLRQWNKKREDMTAKARR